MEVSEHKPKTDKYRLVQDHSCNTFLYTIINMMALIISIADISKWTVPSVMSYARLGPLVLLLSTITKLFGVSIFPS
jgi:hypothetical protein